MCFIFNVQNNASRLALHSNWMIGKIINIAPWSIMLEQFLKTPREKSICYLDLENKNETQKILHELMGQSIT